jgi:hypothetical protein
MLKKALLFVVVVTAIGPSRTGYATLQANSSSELAILDQFRRDFAATPSWNWGIPKRFIVTLKPDRPVVTLFARLNGLHFTQQWCLLPAAGNSVRLGLDIGTDLSEEAFQKWLLTDLGEIVQSVQSGADSDELQQLLKEPVSRDGGNSMPFDLAIRHVVAGVGGQDVQALLGKPATSSREQWTFEISSGFHGNTYHLVVSFSGDRVVSTKLDVDGYAPPMKPFQQAPGALKADIRSKWIAPYVLHTTRRIGESTTESVTWHSPQGKTLRELQSSADVRLSVNGAYVSETRESQLEKVYGTFENWEITLPGKPARADVVRNSATEDSHVFIRETGILGGEINADIYVSGQLAGSVGPYIQHALGGIHIGDDGSSALLAWTNEQRKALQVIVAGPDGKERFRSPVEKYSLIASVLPDGSGVLLEPDDGSHGQRFSLYTAAGKARTLTSDDYSYISTWLPHSQTALMVLNVNYEDRFRLVDWETGKVLWDVRDPNRDPAPGTFGSSIALAPEYILISRAQAHSKRSIYALNIKTGEQMAHWTGNPLAAEGGALTRAGDHIYFIGNDDFSEVRTEDIASFRSGWDDN